ncbi:polyhydroxyalkanoate synthesis regulator phasin [Actinoplanes tereljensis]|uniref:Polyhydroxyalkanoate synthesis regulator phasin n=1 Tax=Paractinoplanes tereljensis TaxID=571912 RepID=A0A919P0Y1_9ACTN|nr:hypothetical protein [Actinoplanes tereljensis]GIF26877.1 hypothetical protein Ate02nite_96070 [Actinoplanes tereljensis]
MPDAWRAYLEMALGLTEAPRKRAQKAVGDLVNRGGATATQLQGLVEDLMSTGMANREALTNIVRYEVDKALGVVGLATAEEVTELTTRVRDLEKELRAAQAKANGAAEPEGTRLDRPAPLPRKVAKKTVAKKAVKATPNAMPSAGTKPATPAVNVAAVKPEAVPTTPASIPVKKVAKKAVAKKAVKKAPGLAESPVAEVKAAAEAVELPTPAADAVAAFGLAPADAAAVPAKKTVAAKKAPAKSAPAKKTAAASNAPAKRAPAKKAADKAAPTNPEA